MTPPSESSSWVAVQIPLKNEGKHSADFKLQIREIMNKYVNVIRTEQGLLNARSGITKITQHFDNGIHLTNSESHNLSCVARLIIESALLRKESRGLNYIKEYPEKLDEFKKDTVIDKYVLPN